MSSSKHNGNLGGIAVADAICQNLASTAALPGTYRAWLSDTSGSPSTRFTRATAPYTLVDGTAIATSWTDLVDANLAHAINKTQAGVTVPGGSSTLVWTGTWANGTPNTDFNEVFCENWTSSSGSDGSSVGYLQKDGGWSYVLADSCDAEHHIYCFQQR